MMNNTTSTSRTYYDILGIDPTADAKAIRQAYLRESLKHHPDKNLGANVDEAKARFIEIGQAYEILKDPSQRASYDAKLKTGTWRTPSTAEQQSQPVYDNYRDAFDAHVAGMSEAELLAAMGVAAAVGSFVGSLIGARVTRGSSSLASIGSFVGSMAASHAASTMVKSLHEQTVERVAYQEERRASTARGEVPPNVPLRQNPLKDFLGKAMGNATGNTPMKETERESVGGTRTGKHNETWKERINKGLDAAKEKATAAAVAAALSKDGTNAMEASFIAVAKAATSFQEFTSQRQHSRR